MPPVVVAAIIAGGAAVGGAAISASGQKSASETAAAGTTAALDYTKTKDAQTRADAIAAQNANYAQYTAKTARLAPYLQAGAGASAMLNKGLNLPPVALPPNPPPPQFAATFSGPTPASAGATPTATTAGTAGGGLVQMRAPDGTVQGVPANQVDFYASKGATRVS